ncbi:MAG: hypothetical protein HY051_00245 [Candidatus Aenigmarchaeota archaeon]|nr:hypothetical protein [Candidatus Aenigmarchaeota archaeon]
MELRRVEAVFAEDLLKLSPRALGYIDILWALHKIGAVVPMKFVTFQLEVDEAIENKIMFLSEMKLIVWHALGTLGKNKDTNVFLSLDKQFANFIIDKEPLTKDMFAELTFGYAGQKLIGFCRNKLTDFITTVLSLIIRYATPEKPAFVGRIYRESTRTWNAPPIECKEILNYYLNRFLGLIKIEDGIMINLSEKAVKRISNDEEVFKAYQEEYKPEAVEKEEKPVEKPTEKPVIKYYSKEEEGRLRKLRQYFPWV